MDVTFSCSSNLSVSESESTLAECKRRLSRNGFSKKDINKALLSIKQPSFSSPNSTDFQNKKQILWKLPFVSDSLIRKANNLIKKYNLNVKLITSANKKLSHVLRKKKKVFKHVNCTLCTKIPDNTNCERKGVIYKFTCKTCLAFYIGKTSRPFYLRFNEHSNSIKKKNSVSALSDHCKTCPTCDSIDDFYIDFLAYCLDPVEATLIEARLIDSLNPSLNRRHERAATFNIGT